MRMFAQHGAFHRRIRVDETDDAEARHRLRIVEGIEEMRERFPGGGGVPSLRGVAGDVLRVAAASEGGRRVRPGSAQHPSAGPRGSAVDDGRRGAGSGRSPRHAVGGQGAGRRGAGLAAPGQVGFLEGGDGQRHGALLVAEFSAAP